MVLNTGVILNMVKSELLWHMLKDEESNPKHKIIKSIENPNSRPLGQPFPERERTRSLNAPSPFQQFGPCGRIMKNSAMVMTIQDPASQRLTWYKSPMTVLVIKKHRDAAVIPPFFQLVQWFINEKRMVVFVEAAAMDDQLLTDNPAFTHVQHKLKTFTERDDLTDKIDFIVCLGGDGTLLYASSLFQQSVPPVMAFHTGPSSTPRPSSSRACPPSWPFTWAPSASSPLSRLKTSSNKLRMFLKATPP